MYQIFKRFFDLVVSLLAIIGLSPIIIPLLIILRLTGEGEIFYRQKRIGYLYKSFNILKFATMLKDSLNLGSKTVTIKNDPRITPIGKYLRITKINELPQLINVLLGEMSFVGPRPLLENSYMKYEKLVRDVIYLNKPGITGLGSIVFRDEEQLVSSINQLGGDPMDYYKKYIYPYKGELELYYYKNASLLTDFKILLATVWKILFRNSLIVYHIFKKLPRKPFELTLEGIHLIDIDQLTYNKYNNEK